MSEKLIRIIDRAISNYNIAAVSGLIRRTAIYLYDLYDDPNNIKMMPGKIRTRTSKKALQLVHEDYVICSIQLSFDPNDVRKFWGSAIFLEMATLIKIDAVERLEKRGANKNKGVEEESKISDPKKESSAADSEEDEVPEIDNANKETSAVDLEGHDVPGGL